MSNARRNLIRLRYYYYSLNRVEWRGQVKSLDYLGNSSRQKSRHAVRPTSKTDGVEMWNEIPGVVIQRAVDARKIRINLIRAFSLRSHPPSLSHCKMPALASNACPLPPNFDTFYLRNAFPSNDKILLSNERMLNNGILKITKVISNPPPLFIRS